MLSNILLYSSAALAVFGTTLAQTYDDDTYASVQEYRDELGPCVDNCFADIWWYTSVVCPNWDLSCVCLIPPPDMNDPDNAVMFGEVAACSTACRDFDVDDFTESSLQFNATCQPYFEANGGVPAPQPHEYYMSVIATAMPSSAMPTPTVGPGNMTATIMTLTPAITTTAPIILPTGVSNMTGNATAPTTMTAVAPSATTSAGAPLATTNAAVVNTVVMGLPWAVAAAVVLVMA